MTHGAASAPPASIAGSTETKEPGKARHLAEDECLRWVAIGETDPGIGTILSISATTVKFHIDAARGKLNARTRAQGVARLVLRGLS